ncbi:hypothetical protein FRC09_008057 [Ceratobasidium sp. 395]|nr:hypothetical protein FRC09_008057 [Ceratobasidium sp. 395]
MSWFTLPNDAANSSGSTSSRDAEMTIATVDQQTATQSTNDDPSSHGRQSQPNIIGSDGLRLRVRIPPRMRRPPPVVDITPAGPELPANDATSSTDLYGSPEIALLPAYLTAPNAFGVFRKYFSSVSSQSSGSAPPDLNVTPNHALQGSLAIEKPDSAHTTLEDIIYPFPNISTFRLAHWFYTGGTQKSLADRSIGLVKGVILAPDFDPNHFRGVNLDTLDRMLTQPSVNDSPGSTELNALLGDRADWQEKTFDIFIPKARTGRRPLAPMTSNKPEDYGHRISLSGFYTRNLTQLIRARLSKPQDEDSGVFHFVPFESWWTPGPGIPPERVYDELYTGDAWIQEHATLQRSPPVPGCNLERVILALMLWSDSTHLAQFGQSSIWPIYLYFGNQSKSVRRKPLSRSCEHLAYLPKITGEVKTQIEAVLGGRAMTDDMRAHTRRDMFQGCWEGVMDDEFVKACHEGIVTVCPDGVKRRVYPRIMSYSADYPEQALIGCVRVNGTHPSPQTLVLKQRIYKLGSSEDRNTRANQPRIQDRAHWENVEETRRLIFYEGLAIKSARVEEILKPTSSVPTISAFVTRLGYGFQTTRMLVPDMLHQFEIGVWKDFFIHLVRLLNSRGSAVTAEFNTRCRMIPTYPPDTIRKFSFDVSEMTKFAARDYEDVLQCCLPAIEGLFTQEQYQRISKLIFTFAKWHALAKLRMHTESTLRALDSETTALGRRLRIFQKYSSVEFPSVVETNAEFEARKRREIRAAATRNTPSTKEFTKEPKHFNLNTPKFHSLGDFPKAIRLFGSTDSYSTQIGELEHRRVKARARRTNQNNIAWGVATIERREAHLLAQARSLANFERQSRSSITPSSQLRPDEHLPTDIHHHIAHKGDRIRFIDFFHEHKTDPAIKDFYHSLQDHLLSRLLGLSPAETHLTSFTDAERSAVTIPSSSMFQHATLRVRYTTYDVRRAEDGLNPRFKHHFVMVASGDNDPEHPFWYAKVIGIYHADIVWLNNTQTRTPRRMEFLWVRWMEIVELGSWDRCELDRVAYASGDSYRDAFGFLDPAAVIRSTHLIPAFKFGWVNSASRSSLASDDLDKGDWHSYYVNRFVDRDMFMRYLGGGIGHFSPTIASTDDSSPDEVEEDETSVPPQPPTDTQSDQSEEISDDDEAVEEDYDI